MDDTGWEARMAARAQERAVVRAAEDILADPHRDHHSHLRVTAVECSCGEPRGTTTVVIGVGYDQAAQSCSECGERGVVRLGG